MKVIGIIKNKPYLLLLLAAWLLFAFSFAATDSTLDFHYHDTYFVVSGIYFVWIIAVVFWFVWTLYFLLHKLLWTALLTWYHVVATLMSLLLLLTSNLWFAKPSLISRRNYYDYQSFAAINHLNSIIILIWLFIFFTGQAAFVVNLVVGLLKRLLKKSKSI